jgi:hypothetical protein
MFQTNVKFSDDEVRSLRACAEMDVFGDGARHIRVRIMGAPKSAEGVFSVQYYALKQEIAKSFPVQTKLGGDEYAMAEVPLLRPIQIRPPIDENDRDAFITSIDDLEKFIQHRLYFDPNIYISLRDRPFFSYGKENRAVVLIIKNNGHEEWPDPSDLYAVIPFDGNSGYLAKERSETWIKGPDDTAEFRVAEGGLKSKEGRAYYSFKIECLVEIDGLIPIKALVKKLRNWDGKGEWPTLGKPGAGNATHIVGFYAPDKENVYLIVKKKPHHYPIPTWLFISALRNSFRSTQDLMCSIDVETDVLAQIQEELNRTIKTREEEKERLLKIKALLEAPQKVTVWGAEPNDSIAKAIVDADYMMKAIAFGQKTLPGIQSYWSMSKDLIISQPRILASKEGIPHTNYARFWFSPGPPNRRKDPDGSLFVESVPVLLLTEREFLIHSGQGTASGASDRLAEVFAKDFTQKFENIAQFEPTFAKLKNIYHIAALGSLLKQTDSLAKAKIDIDGLLMWRSTDETPAQVKGIAKFEEIYIKKDNLIIPAVHLLGGGVAVRRDVFDNAPIIVDPELNKLYQVLIQNLPAEGDLWSEFKWPAK